MKRTVLEVEYLANGHVFVALQQRPFLSFMALLFGRSPLDRIDYFSGCEGLWFFFPDEAPVYDASLVAYLNEVKQGWEASRR